MQNRKTATFHIGELLTPPYRSIATPRSATPRRYYLINLTFLLSRCDGDQGFFSSEPCDRVFLLYMLRSSPTHDRAISPAIERSQPDTLQSIPLIHTTTHWA